MSAGNIILGATGGGNLIRLTTFTSSGTWTKQADVARILVYVVGGGGQGGTSGSNTVGLAGGGGGLSIKLIQGSSLLSSETVTIGSAGGSSSFGAHCSATGGGTGSSGVAAIALPNVWYTGSTGAGGVGIGGDINMRGESPMGPVNFFNGTNYGNEGRHAGGGCSPLFNVGEGGIWSVVTARAGSTGFANSGQGGGVCSDGGARGVGASGMVIIYEYGY